MEGRGRGRELTQKKSRPPRRSQRQRHPDTFGCQVQQGQGGEQARHVTQMGLRQTDYISRLQSDHALVLTGQRGVCCRPSWRLPQSGTDATVTTQTCVVLAPAATGTAPCGGRRLAHLFPGDSELKGVPGGPILSFSLMLSDLSSGSCGSRGHEDLPLMVQLHEPDAHLRTNNLSTSARLFPGKACWGLQGRISCARFSTCSASISRAPFARAHEAVQGSGGCCASC